jgi:ABC-type multidrug transport system fused ATPase/permease subunit
MQFILQYFKIFYSYTGFKLILFIILVLFTTLIDGLGLAMTLPILEFGSETAEKSTFTMYVYKVINLMGIKLSIISLVSFIVFIFLIKAIFKFAQEATGSLILYNLQYKLRIDLIDLYRKMKYPFFINTEIGYFTNIITTEISTTMSAFRKYITMIAKMIMISAYLFYSFMFSWEVSLMSILSLVVIYFFFRPLSLKVRKISEILVKSNTSLQNSFIQFILNYKYLKATSNFKNPTKKIAYEVAFQRKKGFLLVLLEKITPVSLELIAMIMFALSVIFLTIIQEKTVASIMVTMLFLYKTMLRLPEFQSSFQAFMAQTGSVDIVEHARRDLELNEEINEGEDINMLSSQIKLSNADFLFGKTQILSDINIIIPKNSSIGIVGRSGSGKTTLLDIITGLLTLQSGAIEIDNINYNSINKYKLRQLFGYITQEPIIFNDTIFNNITLWSSNENETDVKSRVEEICELTNCSNFINDTTDGFNTVVGDRGIKLSGGQCQRISIARELFRDPEVIIFDEATSALDSHGEEIIQNSIENMIGLKTLIIIAHRLSTVRKCDHIYVLENGKIVQDGKWSELLKDSNSIFSKMCKLQGITN